MLKPRMMIPITPSIYMDLILTERYWITFCIKLIAVISTTITTVTLIALVVTWYNNRLFQLITQFFLIQNRIHKFMNLSNLLPPASISSARI
jgi:hypothetical protein